MEACFHTEVPLIDDGVLTRANSKWKYTLRNIFVVSDYRLFVSTYSSFWSAFESKIPSFSLSLVGAGYSEKRNQKKHFRRVNVLLISGPMPPFEICFINLFCSWSMVRLRYRLGIDWYQHIWHAPFFRVVQSAPRFVDLFRARMWTEKCHMSRSSMEVCFLPELLLNANTVAVRTCMSQSGLLSTSFPC